MFGYGQVQPTEDSYVGLSTDSTLWTKFKNYLRLKEAKDTDVRVLEGKNDLPFLGVIIEEREQVLPALKAFLKKDRWVK
jgi:hypothetical protein